MRPQDHLTVDTDLTHLNEIQSWFKQFFHSHCQSASHQSKLAALENQLESQLYRLNLALAEGFSNAVRHAHAGLPQDTTIEVQVAMRPNHIEIRIWDLGGPFNPDSLQEPEPGTLQLGGYGWFLLRRLVDRVRYIRHGNRNCLVLVKAIA